MKKRLAIEVVCFLFILLFVYAALTKLLDIEKFVVQVGQSPLLMPFAPLVSWAVPLIELSIAVLLIFDRTRFIGFYGAFTIMVAFTAYIAVILTFADHVPCSCGGILEKMGWVEHLIFNVVFVLLAIVGIVLHHRNEKSHRAVVS